ncbi:hypothetical protein ACP3V3_01745 [Vibrio sp. PNB22_3_1]
MISPSELRKLGYEAADLDDLVYSCAEQLAHGANQSGINEQLKFLQYTAHLTGDEILAALKEA